MKIEPFPGKLEKQLVKCKRSAAWKIVLTDEQRAWLIRWFPEEENPRLLKLSGMSHSTLHRYARELHLTKSAAGMKRIKKQHTRKLKRTCERNGYYDSLRGKPVSEATRQGTKRMWQEVREGKRDHPFKILKEQNPNIKIVAVEPASSVDTVVCRIMKKDRCLYDAGAGDFAKVINEN